MEGAVLRRQREFDLAVFVSWHTAVFALNGYAGKLKDKRLSDFLSSRDPQPQSNAAQAVSFFHRMKAAGLPVTIERVVH
jgi:hypothetical protein